VEIIIVSFSYLENRVCLVSITLSLKLPGNSYVARAFAVRGVMCSRLPVKKRQSNWVAD
jgi:hypothetical protein